MPADGYGVKPDLSAGAAEGSSTGVCGLHDFLAVGLEHLPKEISGSPLYCYVR